MGPRLSRASLAGAIALGAMAASSAAAQDSFAVDTSVSVGVASNPVLSETGGDDLVASGTVTIAPSYVWNDVATQLTLNAQAMLSEYSGGDIGSNNSISARALGQHRLNDMLSVNAELGYINSVVGAFNGFTGPITPIVPVDPGTGVGVTPGPVVVAPPLESQFPAYGSDTALGLFGRRQQTYQASGGLAAQLSAYDQLAANISASATRLPGRSDDALFLANDFNTVTPSLTYSRTLGPGFSVSAGLSYNMTDYLGTRLGDATIIQPTVGVQRQINQRWTLSANVGAAISRLEGLNGTFTSTAFMGSASLCQRDLRTNACLSVSRQTLPSTVGGIRNSTSISATGGYVLGERDQLSFSVNYSHASAPLVPEAAVINNGATDFYGVSGTLSHRFRPNFSAFASGFLSKASDDLFDRGRTIEVRVGASYRFGRTQ